MDFNFDKRTVFFSAIGATAFGIISSIFWEGKSKYLYTAIGIGLVTGAATDYFLDRYNTSKSNEELILTK